MFDNLLNCKNFENFNKYIKKIFNFNVLFGFFWYLFLRFIRMLMVIGFFLLIGFVRICFLFLRVSFRNFFLYGLMYEV